MEDNAKNNFVMRKENVLCVAYNTIRLHDYALVNEICEMTNVDENSLTKIFYILNRKEKRMFIDSDISDDTYDSLAKAVYSTEYDNMPATMVAKAMYEMSNQPFTEHMWVMHNTYGMECISEEPVYDNVTYDGSMEQLESFIIENKVTAVFIDSIDTVQLLKDRGKIKFTGMSFFISKIGYNYTGELYVDGRHVMKHSDLILASKDSVVENYEISFIHLWEFTDDQVEELACKG